MAQLTISNFRCLSQEWALPQNIFLRYTKSMYLYILGGFLILIIIWTVGSYVVVRVIEEPSYTLLESKTDYEVRQYKPYIMAETEVTGTMNEATREGFSVIADYIFGNNTSKQSIAMTTPVLEKTNEKIAMTVPVINTLDADTTRSIAFVLPSKYTLETLPQPNNPRVTLTPVPSRKVAVLKFSWYPTEERITAKKQELISQLERDHVSIVGAVQVARYNPPLTMPLLLRNEIIIPIE